MRTTPRTMGGPALKAQRIAAFGHDNREEFARLVGVNVRTVEDWESSRGHVPPAKTDLVRQVLARPQPSWAALSDLDLIAALTERLRDYSARIAAYELNRDSTVTETISESDPDAVTVLHEAKAHAPGGRFTGRSGGPPNPKPDHYHVE